MSTANFIAQDDFPLFARDFYTEMRRCPDCGSLLPSDDETCEFCGCKGLDEPESIYDDFEADYICGEIEKEMDELNSGYMFHKLTLKDGYYNGVQFYVEDNYELDKYDYDNADCRYYFGLCCSAAYRKYHAEHNKIVRAMRKLAKTYGFDRLAICARFSNGEVWYTKAAS